MLTSMCVVPCEQRAHLGGRLIALVRHELPGLRSGWAASGKTGAGAGERDVARSSAGGASASAE